MDNRILIKLSSQEQDQIKAQSYTSVGPVPPYPPIQPPSSKKWIFDDDMSDEFDGSALDLSRWAIENENWKGRPPGWFSKENVKLYKGLHSNALMLESKEEKQRPPGYPPHYKDFSTAFVRTHKARTYGYFEIVCRVMDSRISSAFWFSNPGTDLWTELDVFEYSASDKPTDHGTPLNQIFATNFHIHEHPDKDEIATLHKPRWYDVGFDISQQFVKVGFNWQEDKIQWFINDHKIREERNYHFHQPLHLQLDSETFPRWFGLPALSPGSNSLPNSFCITYVRSWYLDDDSPDLVREGGGEPNSELVT